MRVRVAGPCVEISNDCFQVWKCKVFGVKQAGEWAVGAGQMEGVFDPWTLSWRGESLIKLSGVCWPASLLYQHNKKVSQLRLHTHIGRLSLPNDTNACTLAGRPQQSLRCATQLMWVICLRCAELASCHAAWLAGRAIS